MKEITASPATISVLETVVNRAQKFFAQSTATDHANGKYSEFFYALKYAEKKLPILRGEELCFSPKSPQFVRDLDIKVHNKYVADLEKYGPTHLKSCLELAEMGETPIRFTQEREGMLVIDPILKRESEKQAERVSRYHHGKYATHC